MAKRRWWEHTEAVALGMKELDRGRASVALSPEELEAVERAMAH